MDKQRIIHTHDKAMELVEMFEDVLARYNISVPSPEDDDRGDDDYVGLYGSTFSELIDDVESYLIELLHEANAQCDIVIDEFSGNV